MCYYWERNICRSRAVNFLFFEHDITMPECIETVTGVLNDRNPLEELCQFVAIDHREGPTRPSGIFHHTKTLAWQGYITHGHQILYIIFIDRAASQSREIMCLVASVCLCVRPLTARGLALPSAIHPLSTDGAIIILAFITSLCCLSVCL